MTSKRQIPVGEGLFTWPSSEPRLIGTHCKSCGDYFFPKTFTCRNPNCQEKEIEEVTLSRTGRLYSYSVLYYQPPPPFLASSPYEPRPIAEVEISEGLRLIAPMTQCNLEDIKIGMELEMIADKLYVDEEGNEIIGWKFRPI